MLPRPRMSSLVALALTAATAQVLLPASAPAEARATTQAQRGGTGTLSISPSANYVGGQTLTFSGDIGQGRHRISLQMGRPGHWAELPGTPHLWTARDGSFSFQHPAPSMFNLYLRAKTRGAATNPVIFNAVSQDLVVSGPRQVSPGSLFTLSVDTTPDNLPGRADLDGLPAFPGRPLTLQKRGADGWENLQQTTVAPNGNAAFAVTAGSRGEEVYRVRQEDWEGIGWFPSFPVAVQVGSGSGRVAATSSTAPVAARTAAGTLARSGDGRVRTASKTHTWGTALYDFAWKYGEALTEPPFRGTRPRGWWLDSATGLGRAVTHNGGLLLDSQFDRKGAGYGTTRAEVRGNASRYGRWEATMRLKRIETGAANYHAVIELVPARSVDDACGGRTITVADVVADDSRSRSKVRIGVTSSRHHRKWAAVRSRPLNQRSPNAFAVELSRRHISWFHNGRLIGSVRSRAAIPRVPMTLRLSLVGNGQRQMNHTQFHSDWQRSFSLKRGRQLRNGAKLRASRFRGGC